MLLRSGQENKSRAFGLLQLSLDTGVLVLVRHCQTPHEIWAELRRLYDKPTWTRRLALRQRFHSLQMAEGTAVKDHIVALRGLVNELASIGDPISEDLLVIQLLSSLPPSYHQLLVALEHVQGPGGLPGGVPAPAAAASGVSSLSCPGYLF